MREPTFWVHRTGLVRAPLDRVWSLLSSPGVLSLAHPYRFAFALPAGNALGSGQTYFTIGRPETNYAGEVLEVTEDSEARHIQLCSRIVEPTRTRVFTLAARTTSHGVRVRLTVRTSCKRASIFQRRLHWQNDLQNWMSDIIAVLEGRAPWPATEMPPELQQAWIDKPRLDDPQVVSARVVINAPASLVWQAVSSPEARRMVSQAALSGPIPGAPQQGPGALYYMVTPQADGRLGGSIALLTQIVDQHSREWRQLNGRREEGRLSVTPTANGTVLERTSRMRKPEDEQAQASRRSEDTQVLQQRLERYKKLIELPRELT